MFPGRLPYVWPTRIDCQIRLLKEHKHFRYFFQGQLGSPSVHIQKLMLLRAVVTFRLLRWHCTVDANNLPKHGVNVAEKFDQKTTFSLTKTAERPLPRRVAGLLCIFELNEEEKT